MSVTQVVVKDKDPGPQAEPGPCCAHRNVAYVTAELRGGVFRQRWECWDCGCRFEPVGTTPVRKPLQDADIDEDCR